MYVKSTNGNIDTYPYSVGKLRRDNPNTSFPKRVSDALLASYDVFPVSFTRPPQINERTQKTVQEQQPTLVDGVWTVGWSVVDKTQDEVQEHDEITSSSNRNKRSMLLAETDWWALSDVTMTAEQTAYRQALRDITSHANWPHLDEADWPTKPS